MSAPRDTATDRGTNTFRADLRARLVETREALAPALRAQASAAIEAQLQALLAALAPDVLGFCWPFRGEFDARGLVAQLVAGGMRAALPVIVAPARPLAFREWMPGAEVIEDRYGIHIPAAGETLHPRAILMPVNAFDLQGYRLGYGGGYFDRTLAALAPQPLAIGVGFELARVDSIAPQPHDRPLDAIVTEAGIFLVADGRLSNIGAADAAQALARRLPRR